MKRFMTLSLVAGTALACASTLSVYQDKTFYTYTPTQTYIGLTQNIQGRCQGEQITLESRSDCPSPERLCQLYDKVKELDIALEQNSANIGMLEKLISLPQPHIVDASGWIDAAKMLGKEQTRLQIEKKKLEEKTKSVTKRFSRQTKSDMPLYLDKKCTGMLELTLPYGYVMFDTAYEAELEESNVTVTQKLVLKNQSGIDIKADDAHFYYRSAQQFINPVHFNPWIVGEAKRYQAKKSVIRAKHKVILRNTNENIAAAAAPMQADYEDSRMYAIKHLTLPSTGEPKHVPVMTWSAPMTCNTELFAYRNPNAFEVCSFVPKYQIEKNRWKIFRHGKLLNENAVGEYAKEQYRLYTQIDRDIKVTRERIVQKERETGIFGGTARKKDGFTLTLVNKSDKKKSVAVTERIPTSSTEKIKVKLISVTGSKPLHYQLLKEGKLKMDVSLAPKETEKIKVVFEISYDKELNIDY